MSLSYFQKQHYEKLQINVNNFSMGILYLGWYYKL